MLADAFILIASGAIIGSIISVLDITGIYTDKRIALATVFCTFFSYFVLVLQGAYDIMWRYMKAKQYIRCIVGVVVGTLISLVLTTILGKPIDWLFWALYLVVPTFGICLFRILFRKAFLSFVGAESQGERKRTLIVGAGEACYIILAEMTRPESLYEPVCIVDDDTGKMRTMIRSVMIRGTTEDIPKLCELEHIDVIMFAIVNCPEEDRSRILSICNATGVPVKIIPRLSDALFDNNMLKSFRDIRIEDLLGRDTVSFDCESVEQLVRGRVCMVTGGGGSIGSELCRQLAQYRPDKLVIVDICENGAYDIQQELKMAFHDDLDLEVYICSVRDKAKLECLFERFHPNIVFHAAAHKHVPLMETVPEEAVKNNIFGTLNTAMSAGKFHAEKFVMISTDKAVNPTNVMGATKRCCEMAVQYAAENYPGTEYVSVRFGNVLGSNGSVIPLFMKQIENGGPVTVTHPEITRFFMTIPEAVSLVLQAAAMAEGGEIFVLDMGKPVRIVTLAETLIKMCGKIPGKDIDIVFSGLRPGEKLYEELMTTDELRKTSSKRIFIGHQSEMNFDDFASDLSALQAAAESNDSELTLMRLEKLVPTFCHNRDIERAQAALDEYLAKSGE